MKKLLLSFAVCLIALTSIVGNAEAKRLGGGKSIGMQRQMTPAPAAPTAAKPVAPPQAAPAPLPPQQPKRNWLGILGGLAAGVGLAALLSHFGMGEAVANFLMFALLALAVIFVLRLIFRRKAEPAEQPLQYAGIGGPGMAPLPESAPAGGSAAVQPSAPAAAPNIPADFDVDGFLRVAKVNFVRLQAANDAGNVEDIREFTTPEMFAELKLDIDDRKGAAQRTDVVTLEAELLEVVSEANRHVAAVRFHGMLREEANGAATAFDEVWTLTKPTSGASGWVLAGISQLS